jgi:hypothetical protein
MLVKRVLARLVVALVAGCMVLAIGISPAHAVVHEIVAQWCSGHDELEPPGLTREGSKNFAQPLEANGFLGEPVFREDLGGLLIPFDFDHPASKVEGTGEFIQIGTTEDGTPLFIELIALSDHPAFRHCPKLQA